MFEGHDFDDEIIHYTDVEVWLLGDPDGQGGDACPDCAPHEQTGPLPPSWVRQVRRAPRARCGQSRTIGNPCRIPVAHSGVACRWHLRKDMPS
jgi:hypothetical protein